MKHLLLLTAICVSVARGQEDRRDAQAEARDLSRRLASAPNTYVDPVRRAMFDAQKVAAAKVAGQNDAGQALNTSQAEARSNVISLRQTEAPARRADVNVLGGDAAAASGSGSEISALIQSTMDQVSKTNADTQQLQSNLADLAIQAKQSEAAMALAKEQIKAIKIQATNAAGLQKSGLTSPTAAAAPTQTPEELRKERVTKVLGQMRGDPLAFAMRPDVTPSVLAGQDAMIESDGKLNVSASGGHVNTLGKTGGVPGFDAQVIRLRADTIPSSAGNRLK